MEIFIALIIGFFAGALCVIGPFMHDLVNMSWAEWRELKLEAEAEYAKYQPTE